MATRTDLGGLLRYDDQNFHRALHEGLKKSKNEIPTLKVMARWRDAQASSEATIVDLRVNLPTVEAVDQIINDLEAQVQTALGPMPDGTLRLQAYEPGKQGDPLANMQRRLTPKVGGMDHDLSLTLQLLRDSHALNMHMSSQMAQVVASQSVLNGQLAQANAQLASVRGSASAAADTAGGGIWGILGFGALVLYMPTLKAKLGLPKNAPIDQVVERALMGLDMHMQGALTDNGEPIKPPTGALLLDEPGKHEQVMGDLSDRPLDPEKPAPVQPDAVIERVADLDGLIKLAKADPAIVRELIKKVQEHPELMNEAMTAVMGG